MILALHTDTDITVSKYRITINACTVLYMRMYSTGTVYSTYSHIAYYSLRFYS